MLSVQKWIRAKIYRLLPLVMVLGLLTGGVVITSAVKASATDTCGKVLLGPDTTPATPWLQGDGVDVHSNGADEGTATDCVTGAGAEVYNLSVNPPQYGDAWQCEELAQRLYNTRGWYSGTFGAYAALIYSSPPSGMTTQAQGHIVLANVAPGDMVVTKEDTYGHVFIVNSVNLTANTISVVDQNGADGGTSTLDFSGGSLTDATIPNYFVFSGIVHSPNDKLTNGGSISTPSDQSQQITGDFNGDGYDDIAVFYNYGNLDTKLIVFWGSASGFSAPTVVWDSGPGNWDWTAIKPVVGDFTDNGYDDIGVFYNYGNDDTKLIVFWGYSGGFYAPTVTWDSGPGNWDWTALKLVTGDFTDNGYSDIAVFYNLGDLNTELIMFYGGSSGLSSPYVVWDSGPGNWDWTAIKVIAGDFTGNGYDDIGVFYNLGDLNTELISFWGYSGGLHAPAVVWDSGPGNWDWTAIKSVVGDFTDNGYDDIGVFYNYGNLDTKLIVFWSASGLSSPTLTWDSGPGNWDWTAIKPVVGDYLGNGYDSIGVFYNLGSLNTELINFWGYSGGFYAPTVTWDSGNGNWDWTAVLVA